MCECVSSVKYEENSVFIITMGVEMMFDDGVVVSVLLWAAEVFSQTAMKIGLGEVGCTRSLRSHVAPCCPGCPGCPVEA